MKFNRINLALVSALSATAIFLSGCNKTELKVDFTPVELPMDDTTKNDIQATQEAKVITATSGLSRQSIGYTKLMATGEVNNGETFGAVKDYLGSPIQFADASHYICNGTNDGVGSGLDYFSILEKGGNIYMVSQFECQIGAMYMSQLTQDKKTGALSVMPDTLEFIDQSSEFGGFVHCAGQTTPWDSHLGSEEYETDARMVEENADPTTGLTGNKYYDETAKFWANDATKLNPYYYGWTPEVQVSDSGEPSYMKHYSMGRFSHELAYVMPDQKTVYLSDDGTNVGLFMFVADSSGDLSSGTLYAAKWNQFSNKGLGKATINWISLGHADNATIRSVLDPDSNISTNDAPKFSQIFSTETPNLDGSCPTEDFTSTNSTVGNECLKLNDINGDLIIDDADKSIASRLETRRYAAMMGATTEFRKEEGITFNERDNKLYVAMSEIARGMEDNMKNGQEETKYEIGGHNDIKLEYNACGGVYEMDVASNTDIGSDFVAYNMIGIVAGTPTDYSKNEALSANECDVNRIANPDNVTFLPASDILVIGEDTSKHENNMIWAYNIKKGSMTRIFTTPLGAETTAPFWHKDINGHSYMTTVTQHPGKETVQAGESEAGVIGTFNFN